MKIDLVGPGPPRPGDGPERGRRLRRRRRHRAGHRVPRRGSTGCARSRSTSASPTPRSASACPPWPSGRPATTPGSRPASTRARADGRHDHLHGDLTDRQVFAQTSLREPALSSASQAGLVNNLNDGLAWGLFPVLFAAAGLSVAQIGVLAALYPAVWGARAAGHRRLVGPDRAASRSSSPACHPGRRPRRWSPRPTASPCGRSRPSCSAPAPRWSTRRCSPRSATSPTRPGGPAPSASTGCGATAGSPSAPARGPARRRLRGPRRRLGRRGAHRRLRCRGRGPDVRDAPTARRAAPAAAGPVG